QCVHLLLALGHAAAAAVLFEHRDARRVVAAVFQPLQAVEQDRGGLLVAQVADDAAHRNWNLLEGGNAWVPEKVTERLRRRRLRARSGHRRGRRAAEDLPD